MTPLDRYLQHRRRWEVLTWTVFYLLQATLNSITATLDLQRAALPFRGWEPVLWEFSSNLTLLALVPLVLATEHRWPLSSPAWKSMLRWHLLASLLYSAAHIAGMVLLRQAVYRLAGSRYDFGNWFVESGYEYLKDLRSYAFVLALSQLYGYVILRLQGEARLLASPDEGEPVEPVDRPERFLVRKLRKEFLIAAREIEWLEASGNYVNLYLKGHHYPLRTTMNALEPRLDESRFVRVHRRYMVNLEALSQIEPLPSGDARLLLKDGTALPCSRRFRERLRALGGQGPSA